MRSKMITVIFACVMVIVPAAETQAQQDIREFRTDEGVLDMQAVRASGLQGSIDLNGLNVVLDPETGRPLIRDSYPGAPSEHPDDIYWEEGPGVRGVDSHVNAMAIYNGLLVIGGHFKVAGAVIANGIAAWDGASWSAVGTGFTGDETDPNVEIFSLAVYDGRLIAGGRFKTAGGEPAEHIAAWDGSSWSPMGSGADHYIVEALMVYDGKLVAGGWFTAMDGIPAGFIAAWDGAAWDTLGSGMNGYVYTLATYDNRLIAGGSFSTAGDLPANNIAAWDGSSWSSFGSGTDDDIHALTIFGSDLIAGGYFHSAGGIPSERIASWNGASWNSIGTGLEYRVKALAVYDGKLIAGGEIGDINISAWNGSVWEPLGSEPPRYVESLIIYDGLLVAGGELISADGVQLKNIGSWDGAAWAPLGNGTDGVIKAMVVYNDLLIAGGSFCTIDGIPANRIAAYDGSTWTPLGDGMNADVNALTVHFGRLIAGGDFTTAGGAPVNYTAAWDGAYWAPLGSGNLPVKALAVYDNKIIAGTEAFWPGIQCRITAWDYVTWTTLGYLIEDSSSQASIDALTVYDGRLIAAGTFDHIEGVDAHSIAAWDGATWAPLDKGFQYLFSLYVYDEKLIVGGFWGTLYSWDGTTWTNLWWWEDGWFDSFYSLAEYDGRLIASGQITPALGALGNYITAWDGSTWSPLGSGLNFQANALCPYDGRLMAGGGFTIAGNKVSAYFACWNEEATTDVLITGFHADPVDNGITLTWSLGADERIDGFRIYRSQNGYTEEHLLNEELIDPGERRYLDETALPGESYRYTLAVLGIESGELRSFSVESERSPLALQLFQNHPNPFNPVTSIRYTVPNTSSVTLRIYSPSGQLIRTLVDDTVQAGVREEVWDGTNGSGVPVASGVYFCRLCAGKVTLSKKMLLLR